MENGRYVLIRCRACHITTLLIAGRRWPKRCIRCDEPVAVPHPEAPRIESPIQSANSHR